MPKGIYKRKPFTENHKKNMREVKLGENNPRWVGDDIGYRGLHHWLVSNFGVPIVCDFCKKTKPPKIRRRIHWANKTGKYLRDRKDWLKLCASCHKKYDLKYNK